MRQRVGLERNKEGHNVVLTRAPFVFASHRVGERGVDKVGILAQRRQPRGLDRLQRAAERRNGGAEPRAPGGGALGALAQIAYIGRGEAGVPLLGGEYVAAANNAVEEGAICVRQARRRGVRHSQRRAATNAHRPTATAVFMTISSTSSSISGRGER